MDRFRVGVRVTLNSFRDSFPGIATQTALLLLTTAEEETS